MLFLSLALLLEPQTVHFTAAVTHSLGTGSRPFLCPKPSCPARTKHTPHQGRCRLPSQSPGSALFPLGVLPSPLMATHRARCHADTPTTAEVWSPPSCGPHDQPGSPGCCQPWRRCGWSRTVSATRLGDRSQKALGLGSQDGRAV